MSRSASNRKFRRGAFRRSGASDGRKDYNPAFEIARRYAAAVDPMKSSGRVTTLAQMSPEKRAEMERLYNRQGNNDGQSTRV